MKTNLHLKSILTVVMAAMTILPASAAKAKNKFQNFKVSTYILCTSWQGTGSCQECGWDVARMADEKFLNQTWEVDLDKIYLETHRNAFTVDEKTMLKVKMFFLLQQLK